LVFLVLAGLSALAAESAAPDFLGEKQPRTQLLLLGTFHFDDAGLDAHKPEHGFDALSERRQKEIEEVLDRLARFRPTHIAVEYAREQQERLDQAYAKFLAGESEPRANEIYQIGFRLGKRLGLERVVAVDAEGRAYEPDMTDEQYEARVAALLVGVAPERVAAESAWDERFEKLYKWEDGQVDTQSLRKLLLYVNEPEVLVRHHGHYLVGDFKLGRDDDYFGADLKTRWYNRNLRIFHNLLRIPAGPSDRVLLVIGAGHVPILRHAALSSPDFRLAEVESVLGDAGKGR
jgi:hypothetical protein